MVPVKIHTQDDFIIAMIARGLRHGLDEATEGFLEYIAATRTEEEKLKLFERADKLEEEGATLPSAEEMKKLSGIFTDLPKDGWEMLERQQGSH
jgi:hypothetical protein